MSAMHLPSLRDALAEVPDFRQAQGRRYELLPVLLLCCVAVMCGARSQSAIAEWGANYGTKWLDRLGIRRRRAPSQPTLHRLFKGLDCAALERAVTRWAEAALACKAEEACGLEAVAIDGKTLRGSARQGTPQSHLISALSHRLGVVMAQLGVADKSHELGHLEPLLDALVLSGRVVTTDALHTHKAVARRISAGGGDYLLPVKDNQPLLRQDIALVFASATPLADTITEVQSVDAHGDRIETRRLRASTALVGYTDFPAHQQVLELRRTVTNKRTGKTRQEVVYGITSLSPQRATAAELLQVWREHWHIENKLHYVRDVTFDEDRSQVRTQRIPQVMATLRNVAISLLRLSGAANIAAACRRYAAQPALALAAVGISRRE
ncbi:MAG: ISAs1 family transposase [Acidobacteriota bacterium]|nr:ISAs1 family transposase [Acidobacteriota bacterium]